MSAAASSLAETLLGAMQRYWGYDAFRPLQREAMTCVMGRRDSVTVLPTGGGKSLCFQVPAVCRDGLAVVVSPLISLMKDQVDALVQCGVPAAAINSTMSAEERRIVAAQVRSGELRLLYVAPERLLMPRTLEFLGSANVQFAAIDEAHCISAWGHDFRPEYRGLRVLKEVFPQASVHAFTATASNHVQRDIAEQLGLRDPVMLIGSFDRPNLTYRIVRGGSGRFEKLSRLIEQRRGESGIVYCISRKEVEKVADGLVRLGHRAAPYHAGLGDDVRHRNQDGFLEERLDVIVATVAFGMGIDKSNVRFVIHNGMPKSLEHYVQESGRAGRDGLEAECVLLASAGDAMVWKRMIEGGEPDSVAGALRALEGMSQFVDGAGCRHRAIVEYFGQEYPDDDCGACDVCLGELDLVADPVVLGQKIVSCVARLDQRYGADYTAKVLVGSAEERILSSGHDRLSTYGLLSGERQQDVRQWVDQLVGQGYLARVGEYNTLEITPAGRELLRGERTPQLLKPAPVTRSRSSRRAAAGGTSADSWEGVDRDLFEQLRKLRLELASERGVPPYVVFSDATLRDMARRRPSSLGALLDVKGVGEKKRDDYGHAFVEAIVTHCTAAGVAMDQANGDGATSTPPARTADSEPFVPALASLPAFDLFKQGLGIDEVAQQLGRVRSTVVKYLGEYIQQEQAMDPSGWVDPAAVARIEAAYEQLGGERLKPIYEQLGGDVSYDDIRIVLSCLANR
ncbi:MAG: DNA helicase RecQ [Planctomycetales bacterium]|nr:DNA helicase RecQ [Planctomycetales bacterium]